MAKEPRDPVRDAQLLAIARDLRAVEDTIDYLSGIKSHLKAQLRGELDRLGQNSTTIAIPHVKLELKPFIIAVCGCHGIDPGACPAASVGTPIVIEGRENGNYLSVSFEGDFLKPTIARFDDETVTVGVVCETEACPNEGDIVNEITIPAADENTFVENYGHGGEDVVNDTCRDCRQLGTLVA
jgi:hypothetical protein